MNFRFLCVQCILWTLNVTAKAAATLPGYSSIGYTQVFIGKANDRTNNQRPTFRWFDARLSCWARSGQLISVETPEQMVSLQAYVVQQGYANGSIFSTSGHSYLSEYPYKWDALKTTVTYTKWLLDDPVPSTFLSLQLIDSELYMIPSDGFDDYYICEYVKPHWFSSNLKTIYIPLSLFFIICVALVLAKTIHFFWKKGLPRDTEKELII